MDDEPTDDAIRALASELIRSHGPNHAARDLGVNRITVLGLAAGAHVVPATFALIRENLRRNHPATREGKTRRRPQPKSAA